MANCVAMLLVWVPRENFNCNNAVLVTYLSLEIFRVARLARLLQFTSRYNGIRVLILSLTSSIYELLLLLSGLLTAVVVFGLTIYVSEIGEAESNYDDFMSGFWWALVSMTTIGKTVLLIIINLLFFLRLTNRLWRLCSKIRRRNDRGGFMCNLWGTLRRVADACYRQSLQCTLPICSRTRTPTGHIAVNQRS